MFKVRHMTKVGMVGSIPEFRFEFEFDNASTLPEKMIMLSQKTYIIAAGSTAINQVTNICYRYSGVSGNWVKALSTSNSESDISNATNFTSNGSYNVINNESEGYSNVTVNVSQRSNIGNAVMLCLGKVETIIGHIEIEVI